MARAMLSSGDILADRRAAYAEMLMAGGDPAAAAELMASVTQLAPGWSAGWFRLGEMREAAGDGAGAVEAFRQAQKLDPADAMGAGLKLALFGEAPLPDTPPAAFVEALFDTYAGHFNESLVGKLGYRLPERLLAALRATGRTRFAQAIDLGCGTGLMGARLRPVCERLTGVDLSAEMLKQAQAGGAYDRLVKADLAALNLPERFDLVTAADVFIYVGTLDVAFRVAAGLLGDKGLFAFSVEVSEGEDLVLRESRRYAHGRPYVERELARAGLVPISISRETIRTDRGVAVEGLIGVAEQAGR